MNMRKCHYCGGTISFNREQDCYICDYCQNPSIPSALVDEEIEQIKERANKLYLACDFDGAATLYQSVVSKYVDEAEAYWFLALCAYGVQYVDDPETGRRIPTCHRTLYTSILNNEDYINAIECTDLLNKDVYQKEAKKIDDIQKGILTIVAKEEPYDIFICYKESDNMGSRTKESDIAKDLYYKLTSEGYKTFYAPVTLQEKVGEEYEPYIFAALNTAKLMVVIGFSENHFNAPWVKNEWSRFLTRKANNPRLVLISCYNSFLMNASDLPIELSKTQAKDMANASTNDLVKDIRKIIPKKKENNQRRYNEKTLIGEDSLALCRRGQVFLDDRQFSEARNYFNRSLDKNPELSKAYWGIVLANMECSNDDELAVLGKPIHEYKEYKNAIRFANESELEEYEEINNRIQTKINNMIKELRAERYKRICQTDVQQKMEEYSEITKDLKEQCNSLIEDLKDTEEQIRDKVSECNREMSSYIENIENNKADIKELYKLEETWAEVTRDKDYKERKEKLENIMETIESILNKSQQMKKESESFIRLDELKKKQTLLISKIEKNEEKLQAVNNILINTHKAIDDIIDEFEPVFSQVKNGEYILALSLLKKKNNA